MEKHEQAHHRWHTIFVNNFIGGVAWGLGATVGLSIVVTLLGFIFTKINLIPFVGTFVADIMQFVAQKNGNLLQ